MKLTASVLGAGGFMCQAVGTCPCMLATPTWSTFAVWAFTLMVAPAHGVVALRAPAVAHEADSGMLRWRRRNAESCPDEVTSERELRDFGILARNLPEGATVRMCEKPTDHSGGILYVQGLFNPSELKVVQQYLAMKLHRDDDQQFWQNNSYYDFFVEGSERNGSFWLERLINVTGRAKPGKYQAAKDAGHYPPRPSGCFHHDRHSDARRTTSVVAYIQAPLSGGHTVFPTVLTPGRSELPHLAKQAAKQFPMDGRPWSHDLRLCYGDDDSNANHVSRLQDASCEYLREADKLRQPYKEFFGIAPVPGDAVIFNHWDRKEKGTNVIPSPEWNHFHNGCGAVGPKSKVAIQYFAEGFPDAL